MHLFDVMLLSSVTRFSLRFYSSDLGVQVSTNLVVVTRADNALKGFYVYPVSMWVIMLISPGRFVHF